MNWEARQRLAQLGHELESLNEIVELQRAELYWNMQSLARTRRRSAAISQQLARRRGLWVRRDCSPTDRLQACLSAASERSARVTLRIARSA
jgi:hypothetical protein